MDIEEMLDFESGIAVMSGGEMDGGLVFTSST
jgi:hypothetical protein